MTAALVAARTSKTVSGDCYLYYGNPMDRPSATRFPGMNEWVMDPVPRRPSSVLGGDWWSTTVYQHIYWYEDDPKGVRK